MKMLLRFSQRVMIISVKVFDQLPNDIRFKRCMEMLIRHVVFIRVFVVTSKQIHALIKQQQLRQYLNTPRIPASLSLCFKTSPTN